MNKMNILDQISIYNLKYWLRLFEVLELYCIFLVKITILNEDILTNIMGLGKIKYLLLYF